MKTLVYCTALDENESCFKSDIKYYIPDSGPGPEPFTVKLYLMGRGAKKGGTIIPV